MKILVWATTFGADLWSLTKYLESQEGVTLKIVTKNPSVFLNEPITELFPLRSQLIKRRIHYDVVGLPFFKPDVTILDNHVPFHPRSPKGFVLWHGFGWKGPNDVQEFRYLHMKLRRLWGDPTRPNPNFRWQCFGPWDFKHRSEVSGFHRDNCRIIGSCAHDDLRVPIDRTQLAPYYPFDILSRKTVLIAPTWHYGGVFSHWGEEEDLFSRLLGEIERHGANVILRLHDSFRFSRSYLNLIKRLQSKFPNLLIKFKDRNPDNFLDLQVADVLVSNFSSIANLYYATKRPSVHIYPVKSPDEKFLWRFYTPLGVVGKKVESVRFIWKLPPEDNGGMLARNFGELISQVHQGLEDPHCCRTPTERFLTGHMLGADGKCCERAYEALQELVDS